MKKIVLELTEDELRIIDNELYVAQCRIFKDNKPTVEAPKPSEEHKIYKNILDSARTKINSSIQAKKC